MFTTLTIHRTKLLSKGCVFEYKYKDVLTPFKYKKKMMKINENIDRFNVTSGWYREKFAEISPINYCIT